MMKPKHVLLCNIIESYELPTLYHLLLCKEKITGACFDSQFILFFHVKEQKKESANECLGLTYDC